MADTSTLLAGVSGIPQALNNRDQDQRWRSFEQMKQVELNNDNGRRNGKDSFWSSNTVKQETEWVLLVFPAAQSCLTMQAAESNSLYCSCCFTVLLDQKLEWLPLKITTRGDR